MNAVKSSEDFYNESTERNSSCTHKEMRLLFFHFRILKFSVEALIRNLGVDILPCSCGSIQCYVQTKKRLDIVHVITHTPNTDKPTFIYHGQID